MSYTSGKRPAESGVFAVVQELATGHCSASPSGTFRARVHWGTQNGGGRDARTVFVAVPRRFVRDRRPSRGRRRNPIVNRGKDDDGRRKRKKREERTARSGGNNNITCTRRSEAAVTTICDIHSATKVVGDIFKTVVLPCPFKVSDARTDTRSATQTARCARVTDGSPSTESVPDEFYRSNCRQSVRTMPVRVHTASTRDQGTMRVSRLSRRVLITRRVIAAAAVVRQRRYRAD